jgi:DNA primase
MNDDKVPPSIGLQQSLTQVRVKGSTHGHTLLKYQQWAHEHLQVAGDSGDGNLTVHCPFVQDHRNEDKSPSMRVSVTKGLYYCHGCGAKGTFEQLAVFLHVTLKATVPRPDDMMKQLQAIRASDQAGTNTKSARMRQSRLPESYNDQFTGRGVNGPSKAHRLRRTYWVTQRGLTPEVVDFFGLGYDAVQQSATVPLRDLQGNLMGVIRRRLLPSARPRYVYPKGFRISAQLWGAHAARSQQKIAVCEGSIDALAMWSVGIPAVALLGSHISDEQVQVLVKLNCQTIVVMTDRDAEGRKAALEVRKFSRGVLVQLGTYKSSWAGKDPAELSGPQRRAMFKNATSLAPIPSTTRGNSRGNSRGS